MFNYRKQRGIVAVLVTVGMLAIIGMAGLALDGAHTMLTKTRLQNIVDAATLSAAKTLDETSGDTTLAEVEALAMFDDNAAHSGHNEINDARQSGGISINIEFSNTLLPFQPGTSPARYVRVTATNLTIPAWLMSVMGVTETDIEASAVAGWSTALGEYCNLAPMMVCDANPPPDPDDDSEWEYDPYYGYTPGQITVLKAGSPNQVMERGNFQLVRMPGASGAQDVREALAGAYDECLISTEPIETEPGMTVGPVAQGLNTRMNQYDGPMGGTQEQYPPDRNYTQSEDVDNNRLEHVEVTLPSGETEWQVHYNGVPVTYTIDADGVWDPQIAYDFNDYIADSAPAIPPQYAVNGRQGRRFLPMPVGQCGTEAGQSSLPLSGVMCFFLVQDVDQGPDPDVFGQFTPSGCQINGSAGPLPTNNPGPYVIQLYEDAQRTES